MIMAKFTKQLLQDIQDIIDGDHYSELAITRAISCTENFGDKILLVNLMSGLVTFEMRRKLQSFIYTEYHKLTQ